MARRRLLGAVLVGMVVAALLGPAAAAQEAPPPLPQLPPPQPAKVAGPPETVPGSVLVTRAPGVATAGLDASLRARGLRLRQVIDGAGVAVVDTAGRDVGSVVAELRADPVVTSASPNFVRSASETPDDPFYTPYQRTYAGTVRLPAAWDRTTGSRYVEIAVLDTGVDLHHPDLEAKLLPGWDAVHGDATPGDDHGHGTFVAGVAAGRTSNGEGTAGVSWRSRIIPVKVLGSSGSGTDADVVEGMVWAVDHGADVVNLSLGGPGQSGALDAAVAYAVDHDVTVVAAAGNDGVDVPDYPAASPGVVSVGATDPVGRLASFSNYGDTVDIVAPGMDIASTARGGGYAQGDGTSFAAPLAAGVAALVRTVEPDLSGRDAGNRLLVTARDVGGQGRDPYTGRGLLDAAAAVGAKPRQGVSVPGTDALEPDGTPDRATVVTSPVSSSIAVEGDVDWFAVDVTAAATLTLTVTPPAAGDGSRARELDPVLALYGPGPGFDSFGLADAAGTGSPETLSVQATQVGRYHLAVRNYLATAGPGPFTVSAAVTPPATPVIPPAPPELWVRDTTPPDFATGVAAAPAVSVVVTRDLDPTSVQAGGTVRLVGGITGRAVAATASYDAASHTITIVPSSPLRAGLPYVVRLRGIEDTSGTFMDDLYRFRFTVAA